MTERIRWEPGQFGNLVGYVGTVESVAFQIWHISDDEDSHWSLISSLPDAQNWNARSDDDPGDLKAEAERWLEEFVGSLGAVFPEQYAGHSENEGGTAVQVQPRSARVPATPAPAAGEKE